MGPESAVNYANNNDNVALIAVEGKKEDKKIYKSINFSFLEAEN